MRLRPTLTSLTASLATLLVVGGCDSSTEPAGGSDGNLQVEFRNFQAGTTWVMGEAGRAGVGVPGDAMSGNPTLYSVTNPGLGNSLDFVATLGSETLMVTCTVTSATNASVPPGVVVQAAFTVLDCVDW